MESLSWKCIFNFVESGLQNLFESLHLSVGQLWLLVQVIVEI